MAFLSIGMDKLERADKTSRILDVKYFIPLRSVADVGTPFDDVQWVMVVALLSQAPLKCTANATGAFP